jgi:PAS domain S-box-containing protein
MRIKTQFIIIMILFGIILAVLAASAIITHQKLEKASQQENLAANIAQGASELSYLSNDYLIYRESQQLSRWQSRFASLSNQVASLNVDKPEQQVLVRNIKANEERLKQVFESVTSAVKGPSPKRTTTLDLAFLQVSWSRMAVQSQGLVSDASRLSQLLHQQMDQLVDIRTVLMYIIVGLFGALLLVSYMLTYRRILKSIMKLQAGTAVIGSGNLDFKIEEKKNDEIGNLSHAFNQMTSSLKEVTASEADLEREITERKKAEEELRRQREWLQVTLSSIGDAVIASDTEGRVRFLNPVAETLTGWQSEEALNQPITRVFQIINEKTHQPAEDLVARVLNEKRVVALANDTALVTKDGREVPIEDSAAPILDSTGNIIGAVLVFHDVTEKRGAQVALREAHGRATWLARFPEENPSPVLRASAEGSALYCNPASVDMRGWACEVGQPLPHSLLPLVGQAMAEKRDVEQDVELGERLYSVSVTPFPEEGYANVYGRDITERKLIEQALRESEKRHRSYIELTEQLGWSTNADGEVAEDIPSWRKFTGQSEEEVKGWGWSKSLHPDDLEHTARVWRNAVATKNKYEVEYRIRRYDGVYRHFLARGVPVFKDDGNILEWVGICIDITERKRTEAALRESEQRLNRAQEIAHVGSWELDLVDNRLTWSDEVYRIFGLQPQEFGATYEAFLEAVHPDDRAAVDAAYSGSVREGRDAYEVEHRVVRKSTSEIRLVHERCEHIRDASGQIIRSIGMVQDVTERNQMEEQLRQAEEKSRLLIKYAPSMLYEIDFHGPAFKSVNDVMCQFLGYTREELLAMNPFDLLDDEGKALFRERITRKFAREEISDSVEYSSKTKDGREVHGVLNVSFTYKDGKPQGAVVVAHDITERKRAEEALQRRALELQHLSETLEQQVKERTEELAEANKTLRQLSIKLLSAQEEERKRIAGELHDTLGAYLGGIKFKVENALQEIAKTPKAATHSLNTIVPVIQEAVEECRRIQLDLRPSMLDDLGLLPTLSWFCRRFQTIYSGIRIEKQIEIEEGNVPPPLKIVVFRVTQEAMNNVAKHSKANTVRLWLRKIDGRIELVVEDNGRGIDLEKVFSANSTKGGLGLTNMRERTELSGGSFVIESIRGKGTTIRASWPI